MAEMKPCSIPVPTLTSENEYETWKNDVKRWCQLTSLVPSKRALAVHFALSGRARNASSEIPDEHLQSDNGVEVLLTKLDALFLPHKPLRQFNAFNRLHHMERKQGTKMHDFISEFEHMYFKYKREGLDMNDSVSAYMLLSACSLPENKIQLVMSAVPSDITYANMKSTLLMTFGNELVSKDHSMDDSNIASDPVFCSEDSRKSDVLYSANKGRAGSSFSRGQPSKRSRPSIQNSGPLSKRYRSASPYVSSGSRKTNPTGRNGEPTTCVICNSILDYARECPHAGERKERLNPRGPNGGPTTCVICKSILHWARECPHAYEKQEQPSFRSTGDKVNFSSNRSMGDDDKINFSMFVSCGSDIGSDNDLMDTGMQNDECIGIEYINDCMDIDLKKEFVENDGKDLMETDMLTQVGEDPCMFVGCASSKSRDNLDGLVQESYGCAVLDSGCSATVCGTGWLNDFVQGLSDDERQQIKIAPSSQSFTFGDGKTIVSNKRVTLPCWMGGKLGEVTTDVVDCNIPLLLSRRSMKAAGMILNFKKDVVFVKGRVIKLRTTKTGHYALPISL